LIVGRKLVFLLAPLMMVMTISLVAQECENPANVIRIDEDGKAIFVRTQLSAINSPLKARKQLLSLANFVHKCRPFWEGDWGVNFFTEDKYAFSKHDIVEGKGDPPRDDGWAKAFVGVYTHKDQKLWLMPWIPDKKKWMRVKLDNPQR
jgi:hypothetical protein